MKNEDSRERGLAVMQKLFGATPSGRTFPPAFLDMTVEHLFGEVWSRPGLELRERSLVTVALLAALGRDEQLRTHLRGARNLGVSRETVDELLIHVAHYAGWPAGANGFRIAKEVFDEGDASSDER